MDYDYLMKTLPQDTERVEGKPGPFFIRYNGYNGTDRYDGATYSVVVLTEVLVTCGGPDTKVSASDYAKRLNEAWNQIVGTR